MDGRQLLLQRAVREKWERCGMRQAIEVAVQLAADGSFPGPGDSRRMGEFLKRCSTALRAIDPTAETDIKKLSAEDAQELIQKVQSKGRTGNKEVPVKPDLEKPEKKSTSSGKNLLGLCELPSETARMARTELTERELTKDDISRLADELERRRNG